MSSPKPDLDAAAVGERKRILDAARAAVEEHGPDALTGEIAEHAGLAGPNVYRHFSGKDGLDVALARSAYQEVHTEIRGRPDRCGTAIDVIRAPIAAQVSWADSHPNLYRFLVRRGYQPNSQQRDAVRYDFAAALVGAGARYFPHLADDPGVAEANLVTVIGLVDASVLGWLSRPTETREQLVDRLTTQVWLLIDHHLRSRGAHVDPAVPLPRTTGGPGSWP